MFEKMRLKSDMRELRREYKKCDKEVREDIYILKNFSDNDKSDTVFLRHLNYYMRERNQCRTKILKLEERLNLNY